MSNRAYMPQSKSDIHLTPNIVFQKIEELWGIKKDQLFDPCPVNPTFDGLAIPWKDYNFVNPPYGYGDAIPRPKQTLLQRFVDKAQNERYLGKTSFLLLPPKTDQDWFQDLWFNGHINNQDVFWFDHRLRFTNNKFSATQPHFLVRLGS